MRRSLGIALLALALVFCFASTAVFAEPEAKPKKIVHSKDDLEIEVWVDKSDRKYDIGDEIKVYFRTNRDAFVTIFDIEPDGDVNLLFPKERWGDNFVIGGRTYELPREGQYHISGPAGTEVLYTVASIYYTRFHQQYEGDWDARELHTTVMTTLSDYPDSRWDLTKTEFEVRGPHYGTRRLYVRGDDEISVYLDGEFAGEAPVTLKLSPGDHQIVAMREGYRIDVKNVDADDDFSYESWTPYLEKLRTYDVPDGGNPNWLEWLNIEFKLEL